ncbi:hypothetical protein Q0590_36215 [Rhodocytophaga aerolata]|uniref:Lipoprotein n=1 Tax=Rhodocytophaga aerolata TaxID=455078 RepID=A0ABT8RI42_9BACT|nr:hypothetical protein [Rhodocytophaga aerolata]MDO1451776.1 hypothetical protein [Rhodocytophaga aerolata]
MRLVLLFSIFGLFSCARQEEEVAQPAGKLEYSYIAYDLECCTMVELKQQPLQYSSSVKDSIHTLTYIYEVEQTPDTITYILKEAQKFDAQLVSKGNHMRDHMLPMVNSTSLFFFGNAEVKKEYKVYKYASNAVTMDGCVSLFWVPEIGIILKRNPSWRSFQKLRTNNDSLNRQIELLIDVIVQDQEFYRGCGFEIPDEGFELERKRMILEKEQQLLQRQKRILELQKKQSKGK